MQIFPIQLFYTARQLELTASWAVGTQGREERDPHQATYVTKQLYLFLTLYTVWCFFLNWTLGILMNLSGHSHWGKPTSQGRGRHSAHTGFGSQYFHLGAPNNSSVLFSNSGSLRIPRHFPPGLLCCFHLLIV